MDKTDTKIHHASKGNEEAHNGPSTVTANGVSPNLNQISPTSEMKESQGDECDIGGGEQKEKDLDFRSDARIWYLYLEDAEREAKEMVERWKAGLDSVLVFAVLFAAVVSSFIIDARRDHPIKLEQNLPGDIWNMLPGGFVGTPLSKKWIYALWLTSLYITLLTIIMGVLVKTWLVTFMPSTTRREAEDACHWYRRDKLAQLWFLEEVVTLVPLLLQHVASSLFLGGLIVQNITADHPLGHALLTLCIFGCALYISVTLLPLFLPSSPLNTPLSDLLIRLGQMVKALFTGTWTSSSGWQVTTDINEALADILLLKLIKSPKPTYVDEAAAEISLPTFKKKWIDYLCRDDAPQYLLTRFKKCSSTITDDAVRRNEILGNYLLVFLNFVDHFEEKIGSLPKDTSLEGILPKYRHLLDALRISLKPGYPLHHWNHLPEPLHPLSLALKTQILSSLIPDPGSYWDCEDIPITEFDFCPSEMADRLWEVACQDIHSTYRQQFMLAACRGVLLGQKNVKISTALVLGLSLAKAGWTALKSGRASEWEGRLVTKERDEINRLLQELLSGLYTATMAGLEGMVTTLSNDVLSPDSEGGVAPEGQGLLELIVSSFARRDLWIQSIKILNQALLQGRPLRRTISPFAIRMIADTVVYKDEFVRWDGLNILANIHSKASSGSKDPTNTVVATALLASVEAGLKLGPQQEFLNTIKFIRTLWEDPDHPLYFLVTQFIRGLLEAVLADSPYNHQPALHLVQDMWSGRRAELEGEIKRVVPMALNAGLIHRPGSRCRILADLTGLLQDVGPKLPPYAFAWVNPEDMARDVFPIVFDRIVTAAIYDRDRAVAKALLKQIIKHGPRVGWPDKYDVWAGANALEWLDTAAQGSWWVRAQVVDVIELFIEQPSDTWACGDEDVMVRTSSVGIILAICKVQTLTPEMREAVKVAILLFTKEIINEPSSSICYLWVHFLSNMVKHGMGFPGIVPIILELYVKTNYDSELWENGRARQDFLMLGEHENDPAYIDAFQKALPSKLGQSLHDSHNDWPTRAKWITLLVALSQRPSLKMTVDSILEGIANDVRDGIEPECAPKPGEPDYLDGAMDYMPQSTLKPPLRRLLYKIGWIDRRTWVDILATIAAHFLHKFRDAHIILFEIAKHDTDPDVQHACLKSLNRLSKHTVIRELTNDIIDHFDHFIDNSDRRVRFSYTQLLSSVGVSKEGDLSDKVLEKLSARALLDSDYNCRSEAVNTFLNLSEIEGNNLHPSPKGRYRKNVDAVMAKLFSQGIEDGSWKVRQSWIQLAVGTQIKDAEFPYLTKLVDAAIRCIDSDAQSEAMPILRQLLADATLRPLIAAKLGEVLGSLLEAPEHTNRAVAVLKMVTKPQKGSEDSKEQHQLWIQIAELLSQNVGSQALSSLVEAVIKEETSDAIFESPDTLCSFFRNVKLPEPVNNTLPRLIESTLKLDAMANARSVAINVFRSLIGCSPCRGDRQPRYEGLLGTDYNSQIISRLADIVIKDDDENLRVNALQVLKLAYKVRDLSTFVKRSLSKVIEISLSDRDHLRHHALNAVSTVDSLTEENTNDQYRDIVSPSVPQLLRTLLIEGDEELGDNVKRVLFRNFTISTTKAMLSCDVLVAIPPLAAATTTAAGKATIMRLIETLTISEDTAVIIACDLIPMLKETSAFARATVIEVLLKLYTKHRRLKPQNIESAIPEIIRLVFDDKGDVGRVRITAIQLLLILLPGHTTLQSLAKQQPESLNATASSALNTSTLRFMGLLQDEHLKPFVVDLLSLMSLDDSARETMTLRIASIAFGPDSPILVGHVELLARLISDGRLGEKASDYMMLFLAPVLVTRRPLASFRFEILTALWCQYSHKTLWTNGHAMGKLEEGTEPKTDSENKQKADVEDEQRADMGEVTENAQEPLNVAKGEQACIDDKELQKLLGWFAMALFGARVRCHEAQRWRERCDRYLKQAKDQGS